MGWKLVLLALLHIATLADAMSRSERFWSMDKNLGTSALHGWVVGSAAIFMLVALILSMYLIFDHLIAYNQPEEQKFLIGLILMVPVYAVESFLSLINSKVAFNCEILRDCYEAFALYSFERYLIACLGGEESTIKFMEGQSFVTSPSLPLVDEAYAYGIVHHPFPINCFLRDWKLGSDFYHAIKIGIVQYMILKMICALLAMLFQSLGVYGEGRFEWGYAYPYLAVVLNFCQTWALYCLAQFYSVTKNKLAPIKPLAKFLTFKSIVFLTWWQGVAVAFLFSSGAFKGKLAQVLETRIQEYVICIEMGVAAVIHIHVFPAEPYKRRERCERNVAVMSDYAALEAPPDPEEVQDCERSPSLPVSWNEEEETHPKLHQSVCDVVLGSGGIKVRISLISSKPGLKKASFDSTAEKYRSFLNEEDVKNINWKYGFAPSYDVVNKLFEEPRYGLLVLLKKRCRILLRHGKWRCFTKLTMMTSNQWIPKSTDSV